MGTVMNETDIFNRFTDIAERAQAVYTRELWNGEYYHFDNSSSYQHDSVMADMLAGHWYTMLCNLPPVGKEV
jgi:non-lysosomal glucosylceramidase